MSYKTILVHVDADERSEERLRIAIGLARRYGAHVVGLYVHQMMTLPAYLSAEPYLHEIRQRTDAETAAQAESIFMKAMSKAGDVDHEWRSLTANVVETVQLHARYADLIIVGQRDRSTSWGDEPDFVERIMLAAGRPVLVVPYAGSCADIGNRVLVAWNASREATRAVTDAISLLREAAAVQIISINPRGNGHGAIPGADIGLYLARHGVQVEVTADEAPSMDVGNEILSRAADFSADVIVMGAYGHSRLAELVMGGATRTIMDSMTVPVMLSH